MPMEKKKHEAFQYFKKRCGLTTEKIVHELWNMLGDLQRSYDNLEDEWKTKPVKFLELMILDGCLIMHILLEDTYLPRFNNVDVQRDMLLLENQLPMMLLDKLYSILKGREKKVCVSLLSSSPFLVDIVIFELFFSSFLIKERFSIGEGTKHSL